MPINNEYIELNVWKIVPENGYKEKYKCTRCVFRLYDVTLYLLLLLLLLAFVIVIN